MDNGKRQESIYRQKSEYQIYDGFKNCMELYTSGKLYFIVMNDIVEK